MAHVSGSPALDDMADITVHWLEKSRAQRLVWMLEECKARYNIKTYKRVNHKAPPEMREVHPLGKSPILTIQPPKQVRALVMAESGAIFEYLVDHYGPHLRPKRFQDGQESTLCGETESWLRYRYYMHYTEGSLMSLLMRIHTLEGAKGGNDSAELTLKHELSDVKIHLSFLESQLNSAPEAGLYLCGKDLTAADIMISFPLQVLQSTVGLEEYPGLRAYVARLTGRTSYKAAVEKAETASGERYGLV
ncbi:hypothetical protein PRZ48_005559 [Zasmidium cellare]|uniref:GST N-terminal domain-containing protein n=1 Tax=Zasmidium cellare TaxID=395010 RepID=A0ABR0ELJ1_ZASCE|nr:hypothetical protein PRZ48_005559 [Zasmidium cellare]